VKELFHFPAATRPLQLDSGLNKELSEPSQLIDWYEATCLLSNLYCYCTAFELCRAGSI
jgi:hypothetical protein